MSQTYVAVIINFLVMILPRIGIDVGSEQLTITLQTIVAIVTGIWILVRRYQAGKTGYVTLVSALGVRK